VPETLREALRGRVTKHHRFLLRLHLQQIDTLDAAIAEIDREVDLMVEPFHTEIQLLSSIPGISELSARVILAEIGRDMSRFATAGHLISWAGLCPRNDESAGKRQSSRMRKGAPWLKTTLIQCAWAAARKKGCYSRLNSLACVLAAAPRKPSAPSPHPCSPPPFTCSRMEPSMTISAPITSTSAPQPPKQTASSGASKPSDMMFKSHRSPHDGGSVSF
jgi:hypothetical protein